MLIICYFGKECFKLCISLMKKPKEIIHYKSENILSSLIFTITYAKFFIIILYILRLYNIPRDVNLKYYYYCFKKTTLFFLIPFGIKACIIVILLLILIYIIFIFISFHKKIYKEIHKIFLYFIYRDYLMMNRYTKKIYKLLHQISTYDILQYSLDEITFLLANKINGKKHSFISLPPYHFRKVYSYVFQNKFYRRIMDMSPVLVIIYDCIYNDFVLSHVFYYLLFYVPLKLIHRISTTVGSTSYYITLLVWEVCYGKSKVLYAISSKYKVILDDYLASGLFMNPDLSIQTESFLYDHVRFGLIDRKELLYENPDGTQIKRVGDKFFEVVEDDIGNIILAEEWYLLSDRTK